MREAYIDACALLNLFATGRIEQILNDLRDSGVTLWVMPWVLGQEVLYIYAQEGGVRGDAQPVDPKPLIEAGLLRVALELSGKEEQSRLIELAARVDQGEAETVAAALCRGAELITDDGKTRKLIRASYPLLTNTTTVGLVKAWSELSAVRLAPGELAQILRDIQIRGNFTPSSKDPDLAWWKQILGSEG